jgi:hypothetical protein
MAALEQENIEVSRLLERELELFFGEATDTQARVYARLSGIPSGEDWSLTGTITGPTSRYAQTLSSTQALTPLPGGPPLLAQALVVDPCFWTPDTPNVYTVQVELRRADRVAGQVQRLFGIRPLGVAGQNLFLDNRRWVLRAVDQRSAPAEGLDAWRWSSAAMYVASPHETLCQQASRAGVLLVAEIDQHRDVSSELRRLARWPAVGMIVLQGTTHSRKELRAVAPNALLLQRVTDSEPVVAEWAQAFLIDDNRLGNLLTANVAGKPIIVRRTAAPQPSVADARALCDVLQRDMASLGNFAGYIIAGAK